MHEDDLSSLLRQLAETAFPASNNC